jgi:hypothetical protein
MTVITTDDRQYCSEDPFSLCKETSEFVTLREEVSFASARSLILLMGLVSLASSVLKLNTAVSPSQ